ncbi:MAG: hypothetical protein IJ420_12805 [Lachnospiraceae bacterium]|nr:hypothetical protein [Lachnospiraceae bacterium]MBQ9135478.1 hypothetical protein [Lachnospiraceae bacterium]
MADETNNNPQTVTGEAGQQQETKTFTQEEVNEIVKKRLERERQKAKEPEADPLSEREKALQARENNMYVKERMAAEDLPAELFELLDGRDKAEVDKFIKILKPFIDKNKEPILNPTGRTGSESKADTIREAMGLNR